MVCPYGASLGPSSCAHWEISPGKELYVIHEQLYCAYMWAASCTCSTRVHVPVQVLIVVFCMGLRCWQNENFDPLLCDTMVSYLL